MEDARIYTVGRKGQEALARKGYAMETDYSDVMEAPMYEDAQAISREVLEAYAAGEIGEIYLAYTHFKNTVSHEPVSYTHLAWIRGLLQKIANSHRKRRGCVIAIMHQRRTLPW